MFIININIVERERFEFQDWHWPHSKACGLWSMIPFAVCRARNFCHVIFLQSCENIIGAYDEVAPVEFGAGGDR